MAVPWPYRTTIKAPDGDAFVTMETNRLVDLANNGNPLTLLEREESVTVNGRTITTHYDATSRTLATTEPGGRQSSVTLDAAGRPILEESTGRAPKLYAYDLVGRLISLTEGEGAQARVTRLAYTSQGELERLIDPLGNVTHYSYDSVGRLLQQILPTGQTLTYEYDDDGNLVRETDARGILAHLLPERLGLCAFVAVRKRTMGKEDGDQPTQAILAWVGRAGLPVLDAAPVYTRLRRQIGLRQLGPCAQRQQALANRVLAFLIWSMPSCRHTSPPLLPSTRFGYTQATPAQGKSTALATDSSRSVVYRLYTVYAEIIGLMARSNRTNHSMKTRLCPEQQL